MITPYAFSTRMSSIVRNYFRRNWTNCRMLRARLLVPLVHSGKVGLVLVETPSHPRRPRSRAYGMPRPPGRRLTGASSMRAPARRRQRAASSRRLARWWRDRNRRRRNLMPAIRPSGPSATASTSGGSGNEVKMTSASFRERARALRPGCPSVEMMAGGLPVEIVDDQLEAGLLQGISAFREAEVGL